MPISIRFLRCTKTVVYTTAVFSISVYRASLDEWRLDDDEMMAVIFARWRCKQRRLSACVTAAFDVNLVTDIAASKQLTPRRMLSAGPTAMLLYYNLTAPAVTCNGSDVLSRHFSNWRTISTIAFWIIAYRLTTDSVSRYVAILHWYFDNFYCDNFMVNL